jgi:cytosine/uracil/thiamine/allantoin permease
MTKIKALLNKIKKYETQRKIWIAFSVFFVSFILSMLIEWKQLIKLDSIEVWIAILTILISTGISWWYWTMTVLRNLLREKQTELELLIDLSNDIKSIKQEVINESNKY